MIALCTAFKKALIGVSNNGKEETAELDSNCKHSENLLLNVDKLLDNMNLSIKENDSFGVVLGPGSFTGVRIAISLVKGLLAGQPNKKLVSLTSFELMAYTYINNYKPQEDFVCVIDGLSGFYFVCHYNSKGEVIEGEKIISKSEYELISLKKIGLSEENVDCDEKIELDSCLLLNLCNQKLAQQQFTKPCDLIPLYLRKSQAEVSLEEKNKKV